MQTMKQALKIWTLLMAALLTVASGTLQADSYWDHNGSTMRLVAEGEQRLFYYHVPRPGMVREGVRQGTLLFNGTARNDDYEGIARRFSAACVGDPLEYAVSGQVVRQGSQLQIVLQGPRPIHSRCVETGRIAHDTLVFTYLYSD